MAAPLLAFAALAIALIAVYAPVSHAPLLPWDDDYNLTKNPFIALGQWTHLWTTAFYGMYVPVTDTVWAALYALSDGAAWPFRMANLSIHFANACMVYALAGALLQKLNTPSRTAAFCAAVLFALHPLQVGSVAWISDFRGILSVFFGLASVLVFWRKQSMWNAAFAAVLFALGLLSKPQIAALPIAMLIYAAAFDRKWLRTAVVRLSPWFAASAVAAYVTRDAQAAAIEWTTPLWMRPIVMADSFGFYAIKTIYPFHLAVDYGRTPFFLLEQPWRALPNCVAFLAVLFALTLLARRDRKWALGFAWFAFLLPTSGLLDFGYQQISTVADHYNYAPLIVVSLLASMMVQKAFTDSRLRNFAFAASTVVACTFALLSSLRAQPWANERDFFEDMIAKNDRSYSGFIGLTNLYCADSDRFVREKGLEFAKRAAETRPEDAIAVADILYCLNRLDRTAEALTYESHFHNAEFVRRMKRHDFAAASLLTSIGGAAFRAGQIDKGFLYACEGAAVNAMNSARLNQVEEFKRVLSARGDHRTCSSPIGLEAAIASASKLSDAAEARQPAATAYQ